MPSFLESPRPTRQLRVKVAIEVGSGTDQSTGIQNSHKFNHAFCGLGMGGGNCIDRLGLDVEVLLAVPSRAERDERRSSIETGGGALGAACAFFLRWVNGIREAWHIRWIIVATCRLWSSVHAR